MSTNTLNAAAMQRGPARDALNVLCAQYGFDAAQLSQLEPRSSEVYSNGTVALWQVAVPDPTLHDVSVTLYLASPGKYTWDVSVTVDAHSKPRWHVTPEQFRLIVDAPQAGPQGRNATIALLLERLDALGDQPVRETARVFQAWAEEYDVPVADIVSLLARKDAV